MGFPSSPDPDQGPISDHDTIKRHFPSHCPNPPIE
jgi:hypothetical protein